jgi:hypothetical protein
MASRSIRIVSVGLGGALLLWGSLSAADEGKKVVVVGDGPDGTTIVSDLGVHIRGSGSYSEGDSDAFRAALGPAGVRSLAAAARRKDRDADLVARVRAAARKAHADRAVVVHTEKGKKQTLVHAWVIDAQASGAEVDEDVHVAPGTGADDAADAVWGAIGSAFPAPEEAPPAPAPAAATSPAPSLEVDASASAKPPDADTASTPAAAPRASDHTRAGSIASVGLQMEGGSRHFSYVDRLTSTLRPYDLFVAPVVKVNADVYPFLGTRIPVLSGFGAQGSYAHAFALSSQDEAGTRVGTSWQAFDLGVRERLPLGQSFILGIDLGYGDTRFTFDDAITPTEQLPSVHYKYLRGGLDGRYVHGDLSFTAGVGYRDVMSTGDFAALFPRASVGGFDAGLGAAVVVAKGVEISLQVDYARYFYSLLPQPGDKYVAGGALDEMASLSLGASYLF